MFNSFFFTVWALDSFHGNLTTFHLLDTKSRENATSIQRFCYFLFGYSDRQDFYFYPSKKQARGQARACVHSACKE